MEFVSVLERWKNLFQSSPVIVLRVGFFKLIFSLLVDILDEPELNRHVVIGIQNPIKVWVRAIWEIDLGIDLIPNLVDRLAHVDVMEVKQLVILRTKIRSDNVHSSPRQLPSPLHPLMELVKGGDGIWGVEGFLTVVDRSTFPPVITRSELFHEKTSPIIIIETMPKRIKKASVPIPDRKEMNLEESRLVVV